MLKGVGKQETPAPIETEPMTIKVALSPEIEHMSRRVQSTEAVMKDGAIEKGTGAEMTEDAKNGRRGNNWKRRWVRGASVDMQTRNMNCRNDTFMAGIKAPVMNNDNPVTGANKERHRIENKRRHQEKQATQEQQDYWSNHKGRFSISTPKQAPSKHKGGMCLAGLALHHPAADLVLRNMQWRGVRQKRVVHGQCRKCWRPLRMGRMHHQWIQKQWIS